MRTPISLVLRRHRVCRHAVEPDRGQDERDHAEHPGQARHRSLPIERPLHLLRQGADIEHRQVGICLGQGARHLRLQHARRHVGHQQYPAHIVRGGLYTLHHLVGIVHRLHERNEEHRTHRALELKRREPGVAHHAHDAEGIDVLRQVQPEVLVERIFLGLEKALHERLVYHGHVLGGLVVGLGEVAAAYQLDAQVLQVVGANAVPRRACLLARRRRRPAGHEHALAPVVRERVVEREPSALHARDTRETRFHVAIERGEPFAGERRRRTAHGHDHAAIAVEAKVLPLQIAQAAPQHRRAGHEHHGERGLHHEQRLAGERRAITGGAAGTAERIDRIRARREPRRAAPKNSPVKSARPVAKASTRGDGVVSIGRLVALAKARESRSRAAPVATISPIGPADCEQHALHQRLGHDLLSRRAQGQPHGGRSAARHRAGQQQVRHVGAGDEQHERAHGQQDLQAAPVLLLHHAHTRTGGDHRDHLLRQRALDSPSSSAG